MGEFTETSPVRKDGHDEELTAVDGHDKGEPDMEATIRRNKLCELITRYGDVFASPGNEGCVVGIEHTVPTTTIIPVTCRPRS